MIIFTINIKKDRIDKLKIISRNAYILLETIRFLHILPLLLSLQLLFTMDKLGFRWATWWCTIHEIRGSDCMANISTVRVGLDSMDQFRLLIRLVPCLEFLLESFFSTYWNQFVLHDYVSEENSLTAQDRSFYVWYHQVGFD